MADSRSLDDLDPRVAAMARALLANAAAEGIRLLVTFTFRSPETQDALYAQGRTVPGPNVRKGHPLGDIVTKAKAGESFHNYGLGFDVVPLKANGAADWDVTTTLALKRWRRIGEIGKELGMRWGGDFHSIVDRPHFEWSGELTLAQLKQGKRP